MPTALLLVLAVPGCDWSDDPPPPVVAPTPPPADAPPPEPPRGVGEVVTPPEVTRASEVQDVEVKARLDVCADPDHATFDALGAKLEGWGFTLVDGDGTCWRVEPPPGRAWVARLEPLAEVDVVREALDRDPFESGAFREGSERYGEVLHAWSHREGGPQESVTGAPPPPAPALPTALPPQAARCLAPALDELEMGVGEGVGWERALRREPTAWVFVADEYGWCGARGWVALVPDAPADTLAFAGEDWAALASRYLAAPRPGDDPHAAAAVEIVRDAGAFAVAVPSAVGVWQAKLADAWLAADPAAARAWATTTDSPAALALRVSEDEAARLRVLRDPAAPADAVHAALTAWRPPADAAATALLERLRSHPDARVRERAWERIAEQRAVDCAGLATRVAEAPRKDAEGIYARCLQADVRAAALARVVALDRDAAAALLAATLEAPETVETGVAAVRAAHALGRDDLLAAVVARRTVARDVRLLALKTLVEARAPGAGDLADVHGAFLGWRPRDGEAPTVEEGGG
ncbi:MAG: hypothetical protein ACOZNI_05155 [Myxococcota bacterium]